MGLAGVVVAVAAVAWRLAAGASYYDDGYVVALALRIARGDLPLADEQSLTSLGALPAVPGVWLWDQLVGTEGLVLASRVLFALVSVAVGTIAYRGMRTTFSRPASLAGVGAALFAIPYQVAGVSYASAPVFALLIGTAAGVALLRTHSTGWAVAVGASGACGAWLVPHMAPAFVGMVACWLLLTRSRRLAMLGLGAAAVVSVVAAVLLLSVVGIDGIRSAVDYTLGTRADRTPVDRAAQAVGTYRMFTQTGYLPVTICIIGTAVAGLRASWRPARVALSALACLAAAALSAASVVLGQPVVWFGTTASALTPVVVIILAIALAGEFVHSRERAAAALAATALATGAVAALVTASTTASGPQYSVHGSLFAGALMVLVALWVRMAAAVGSRAVIMTISVPLIAIASAWFLQPFGDAPTWQLTTRVDSGPWRGVMTTPGRAADLAWLQESVIEHATPGEGVLFLGFPGGYLVGDQRMDTNALWLTDDIHDDKATFAWMERTGRRPSVVIVSAPDPDAEHSADGLRRWVASNYTLADSGQLGAVWVARP